MTFIYELDPNPLEIYRMCKNELFMSRLSKVIVLQTYIHTYATEIIYHGASRMVRNTIASFVTGFQRRKSIQLTTFL